MATKKSSPKKAPKKVEPIAPLIDGPIDEETIAEDQFAVAGREDEASSSGHRVEPIINDEEGNAEKLVEDGLHGYLHAIPKHPRK